MIEITYPDNSKAQYHENGDKIKIIKNKYLPGGMYPQYSKGTIANIKHSAQVHSHPILALLDIHSTEYGNQVSVHTADMESLETPRLSFTSEEAKKHIFIYDKNNSIQINKK